MKATTILVAAAAAVNALPASINTTATINAVHATPHTTTNNHTAVSRIFPAFSCPSYNGVTDSDGLTNGNGGTYTIACDKMLSGQIYNSVGYADSSDAVSTLDCLATCDYQAANGGCCGAMITPAKQCAIITGACKGTTAGSGYETFVWDGPA
ncbi:hypothetical protein Tdes44962_MAKER00984 [Teratosphaeria destructans]|uniref:Uncharacterized protein n=1 Tax=Teratosphaeria destructans TaxID=418781 RepID=A0A9W7SK16_9PEZI|nr:hypothetical protein Tdes44962_MAKER00984 [Teratosphaeria destructans]